MSKTIGNATPLGVDLTWLAIQLECTAHWRNDKAADYPEDDRNIEAATLMDQLADNCRGPQRNEYAVTLASMWESNSEDFQMSEILNEYVGRIGFHHFPTDVEDLCRDLVIEFEKAFARREEHALGNA